MLLICLTASRDGTYGHPLMVDQERPWLVGDCLDYCKGERSRSHVVLSGLGQAPEASAAP